MAVEPGDSPESIPKQTLSTRDFMGMTALDMIGIHTVDEYPKASLEDFDPLGVEWRLLAACRDTSPDLFYPESGNTLLEALAKDVCSTCIVENICLENALIKREAHGIWGGTNPDERRLILRRRTRKSKK